MVDLITIPEADVLAKRLEAATSSNHEFQKLVPKLMPLAGRKLYDVGVNMALESAFYELCDGAPNVVRAAMNLNADRYIEALCPDETHRAQVMACWKKTH